MLKRLLTPSSVFIFGLAMSHSSWAVPKVIITYPSGGGSRAYADTTPETTLQLDKEGNFKDSTPISDALNCVAPKKMECDPKKFNRRGGNEQTMTCECK